MRAVILLTHDGKEHEAVDLKSIKVKTKNQNEIILQWNDAKTTRTRNQAHVITDEITATIKSGRKFEPFPAGENLDYYRYSVQKARIEDITVHGDKQRKMRVCLKSVILHEKQPDNRDIGLGIPISNDPVTVKTTAK